MSGVGRQCRRLNVADVYDIAQDIGKIGLNILGIHRGPQV